MVATDLPKTEENQGPPMHCWGSPTAKNIPKWLLLMLWGTEEWRVLMWWHEVMIQNKFNAVKQVLVKGVESLRCELPENNILFKI